MICFDKAENEPAKNLQNLPILLTLSLTTLGMDDAFDNAQESARPGTADTGDSGLSAQPIADTRKAVSAPIRKGPAYQQPR